MALGRRPLRRHRRAETMVAAELVESRRWVQRKTPGKHEIVTGRDGGHLAPMRAGAASVHPFAASGEAEAEEVRLTDRQRDLAFAARARGPLIAAGTVGLPIVAVAEHAHPPKLGAIDSAPPAHRPGDVAVFAPDPQAADAALVQLARARRRRACRSRQSARTGRALQEKVDSEIRHWLLRQAQQRQAARRIRVLPGEAVERGT